MECPALDVSVLLVRADDVIILPPPPGQMTQDLVEQFDSRWLGTGEYDPSMAPEGPASQPRAGEFLPL